MYKNFNLYKNKILAISLIAIFAISIAMTFAPSASAQFNSGYGKGNPVRSYTTESYITVAPSTIGVGQTATLNTWTLPLPVDYNYASYYFGPNGGSYTGITVTFTRPDGTRDTLMPTHGLGTYPAGVMDALATLFFYYTPNMAGNWSVTMTCPAQNFTDPTGTVMYSASTSTPYYFKVTTEQQNAGLLNGWPYSPLPNSNTYWTYPISANNREWAAISGEFLSATLYPAGPGCGGNYNPASSAVLTGHVLWDTQAYMGGIIGGGYGSVSYVGYTLNVAATLSHVIMEGKLYVNLATSNNQFQCYDLKTGKLLFTATGVISAGIHLPGNAFVQAVVSNNNPTGALVTLDSSYGASPTAYLFGTTSGSKNNAGYPTTNWLYYNPVTGQLQRTITNVTVSTYDFIDGTDYCFGATYINITNTDFIYAKNYILKWNITRVVGNDWWTGVMWTHTVNNPAKGLMGPTDGPGRSTFSLSADLSTIVYGGSQGDPICDGFSTQDGNSLWNLTLGYISMNDVKNDFLYGTNYWIGVETEKNTFHCYSMLTGAEVWKTTLPSNGDDAWNTKAHYATAINDLNNYYFLSPSGSVYALDIATGNIVWASEKLFSTELVHNALSHWDSAVEAGGVLYCYSGYSVTYQLNPIPRFAALQAINVTTGATIWVLNGGIVPEAISAGCLTGYSTLDGNIYVLGKGQTSTSVSAPTTAIAEGTTALIQGSVLDQSPAQPGTPAVSDSSISEQMDYLHMQNATLLNNPPQEQGVPVTLTALDPNMNTVTIGTTTTNSAGNFGFNFVPKTTGIYTITASFSGTNSYWPSTSQTMLTVVAASSSTTSAPTTTTSTDVTTPILMAAIAIIIAIVIVGIAIILLQRKRP